MLVSGAEVRRARAAAIALLGALVAACATGRGAGDEGGTGSATTAREADAPSTSAATSSRDVLTGEQLGTTAANNLYDAIHTLRPELLTGRGLGTPDVYVRGAREPQGVERLKELPLSGVEEVRYLRMEEARRLAGQQSQGGAIVVTLR